MPRGTVFMRDWETRALAEREQIVVTARCAFCDWQQEGTVQETREAHQQHRQKIHPEISPPAHRKRHRFHSFNTARNLDDNIKRSRQQGASGWAGPE